MVVVIVSGSGVFFKAEAVLKATGGHAARHRRVGIVGLSHDHLHLYLFHDGDEYENSRRVEYNARWAVGAGYG